VLSLSFALPDGDGEVALMGRVVWRSDRADSTADVGVKFVGADSGIRARIEALLGGPGGAEGAGGGSR
jgi:Tfp pilus assembly protein PilZ